jgi:phosphoserine phosphatase
MHDLPPLCVDLDGTLVETDTLYRSLLALLRLNPMRAIIALAAIPKGKARFKQTVAQFAPFDAAVLPYRQDFLEWLQAERASGRRLILATGADSKIAEAVANHLSIFDGVIASDGQLNVTGENKAQAIRSYLNGKPFLYAGDSAADFKIWSVSSGAIVMNPTRGKLNTLVRASVPVLRTFSDREAPRHLGAPIVGALTFVLLTAIIWLVTRSRM